MAHFENPSIHHVSLIKATVTACNEGTENEFGCLSLIIGGDGKAGEMDIYFNYPKHGMAQKYADAINAVQPC